MGANDATQPDPGPNTRGAQAAELVEVLNSSGVPTHRQYSNRAQSNSDGLETTIMKEAWEDAGIDLDNPGNNQQYYFPDSNMLVLDLTPSSDR